MKIACNSKCCINIFLLFIPKIFWCSRALSKIRRKVFTVSTLNLCLQKTRQRNSSPDTLLERILFGTVRNSSVHCSIFIHPNSNNPIRFSSYGSFVQRIFSAKIVVKNVLGFNIFHNSTFLVLQFHEFFFRNNLNPKFLCFI